MRRWLAVIVATLCLSGAARAGSDISGADGAEIQRIITAQIDAFRKDDGAVAFGFAAPAIQTKFGDAAHFLSAVRQAYPAVYRPRSFTFGPLGTEDGTVVQHVEIVGPDGGLASALYDMERQSDGSWRISGCRLDRSALRET